MSETVDESMETIRPGRDADGAAVIALIALIALIGAVFAEYPGCILDVDGEMSDLRRPASAFAARGGCFWVAERAGKVAGCIGCAPFPAARPGRLLLERLYVAAAARGRGLGARLCGVVEAEARRRGCARIDLWTDTRFAEAHRLYARLGYVRLPGSRALNDLSCSIEYNYRKLLA